MAFYEFNESLQEARDCYQKKQFSEGLVKLKQCLNLQPDNALLLFEQSCFLYQLQQIDLAIEALKKSILHEPNSRNHGFLATIFADLANSEQAAFHHAQAFKYNHAATYSAYGLAVNGKFDNNSEMTKLIINQIGSQGQNSRDYARLHFALGEIYLRSQMKSEAMKNFHLGNKYCSEYSIFNKQQEIDKIDKIIDTFTRLNKKNKQASFNKSIGNNSQKKQVFIVGLPRSGSTLLEQMLNKHSLIQGIGESSNISQAMRLMSSFINKPNFETDDVEKITDEQWQKTNEFLHQQLKAYKSDIIVDKQLFNYLYIGCIMLMNPNSFFIDIRRNPADIFRSCYMNLFSEWPNFTHSVNDFIVAYNSYRKLMNLWSSHYPNNFVSLHYETLVTHPKMNLEKIFSKIGATFEQDCLNYHESINSVLTASQLQVKKPLYQSSVGTWEKYKEYFPGADEKLQPLVAAYQDELIKNVD